MSSPFAREVLKRQAVYALPSTRDGLAASARQSPQTTSASGALKCQAIKATSRREIGGAGSEVAAL